MTARRQQYLYLVQLAWNLRQMDMGSLIELLTYTEPALVIPQTTGRLKITVIEREGVWFYAWGHGRKQSVRVGTDDAAERIARSVGST